MNNVLSSESSFINGISSLGENLLMYLPSLAAALFLMVVGWYLAKTVSRLTAGLLNKMGVNKLAQTLGLEEALHKARINKEPADIIGLLFFWLILLLFLITAVETMGLPRLSLALDDMVGYLPKVLISIFILVVGLFVAQALRGVVETASTSMGLEYGRNLGSLAYGIVFIIVLSLAIGELDIEILLLNAIIIIVLAALGLAAALSLGLGTKALSHDIVSGVYARELIRPGNRIEFEGQQGLVEEVSTVKTSIRLDDGAVLSIPNSDLIKGTFKVLK